MFMHSESAETHGGPHHEGPVEKAKLRCKGKVAGDLMAELLRNRSQSFGAHDLATKVRAAENQVREALECMKQHGLVTDSRVYKAV
ncbi:uncharacterized protein LOC129593406 isoform X2 [Paramacrobiotus metropolitanus]|uniref:uncharacterized protein LOC129593406 isoform X2 n=1 Tax=Paramacrobiotus metropolitanus TaxID=2943436 RepID=UPI002445B38C|nr:uncharacterized protein LOC129593406 isoform X2 [Paramacrobiotus metropolitanus]